MFVKARAKPGQAHVGIGAHLTAFLGAGAAGEDGSSWLHVVRHALQQRLQLGMRLCGQDLCWEHYGRLVA